MGLQSRKGYSPRSTLPDSLLVFDIILTMCARVALNWREVCQYVRWSSTNNNNNNKDKSSSAERHETPYVYSGQSRGKWQRIAAVVDVGVVHSGGTHSASSSSVILHSVFSGGEKCKWTAGCPAIKAPWWSLLTCTISLSHFENHDWSIAMVTLTINLS
jgi:hypothetical protein